MWQIVHTAVCLYICLLQEATSICNSNTNIDVIDERIGNNCELSRYLSMYLSIYLSYLSRGMVLLTIAMETNTYVVGT